MIGRGWSKEEMGRKEVIFLHLKYLLGYVEWRKRRIYETGWRSRFLKQRTELTSVSPTLDIHSVTVATIFQNTLCISLSTVHKDKKNIETQSMIDSGAGGTFINQNYAKNLKQNYWINQLLPKTLTEL